MMRGGGGHRSGSRPGLLLPCQRSMSTPSANVFKARNESSSVLPSSLYGISRRPPTSHGRIINNGPPRAKFERQYTFTEVSGTKKAFAPRNKPNANCTISSRLHQNNPHQGVPYASRGSHPPPVAAAVTNFRADPSYDVSLGGVVFSGGKNQFVFSEPFQESSNSRSRVPLLASKYSAAVPSWRINSVSGPKQPYVPPPKRNMVSSSSASQSQSQLSLLEQKKRQWAKEREELSGLWSPWGKDPNKIMAQSHPSDNGDSPTPTSSSIGSMLTRPGGNFANYSSSDHYLPPINDSSHHNQHQQNLRLAQRSHSLIPENDLDRDFKGRKGSLPDGGRRVIQLQPYEQKTTFHKEGNAEWMIIHNGNGGNEGGITSTSLSPTGDGDRSTSVVSPRVIVHKIMMDATEERTSSRMGEFRDNFSDVDMHHQNKRQPPSYDSMGMGHTHRNDSGDHGSPLTRSSFGGSTGYLGGNNKPPPVAMRSSLTIGLPSPRSRFGGSFEDIEKKEKQQWLNELEKQREEQRMRKFIEKDDKRARWGDRGVGVGHFWEPSDSSRARLPSRENDSRGRHGTTADGGPSPPAWAKRSIESSRSQPNLYNGPLPAQLNIGENNNMSGRLGLSQGHIANFNRSSIEIGSSGRSPLPEGNTADGNHNYSGGGEQQRTFLRGQNNPIDPNEMVEHERKARARQEYLEDVKKQIEDNKRRQKEEKERQLREDREHEMRMEQQRELELQRLEMEKRKRNIQHDSSVSDSTLASNVHGTGSQSRDGTNSMESESDIQIFEVGQYRQHSSVLNPGVPLHESPLIPNHFVPEPDAYEMAIARRQVMTLTESQSQSTEKSESISISSETDPGYFGNHLPHRSTTPTPPTIAESIGIENGNSRRGIDQCLMTDSDHIYQRTLTPSIERRSRSMDTARSREFGTQTEVSDLTTDADTDREHIQRNSIEQSKTRSKSISNIASHGEKKEEKPRWGSNPEKKVYMKQSEKDPNFQKKLRRRQPNGGGDLIHGSTAGETDTTNENDELPFHRVQNRARTKERDRLRKNKSPLKALPPLPPYNHNPYLIHGHTQSHSRSHVSAHLKTDDEFHSTTETNSSLNGSKVQSNKFRSPKIGRQIVDNRQVVRTNSQFSRSESSLNRNTAQKHLGHIGDGLNSVGGSEESCTGSGFTSPYPLLATKTRPNCSTGDSNNSSIPSSASASNSDYVPMFSTEFKSQREFDEMPIGGGKANPYLEKTFLGNRVILNPVVKRPTEKVKISHVATKPKLHPTPIAPKPSSRERQNERKKVPNGRKNNSRKELENVSSERQDVTSPPVPALAKKMEMGLYPDGNGRLSSFPPELLSPLPTIPLGAFPSYTSPSDIDPSQTDGSRLSSAEPKVDIDIAITHASNPDLQELLHNIEQSAYAEALLTGRSELSHPSLVSGREEELAQYPELVSARENELISARSAISGLGSRPVTNATDLSLQAQEEFIRDLMSHKEVQQQLSARENELSEKGIIEFNIRLPSNFAPSVLTSGKSRKTSSRSRESQEPVYHDPLISHSERRKATVQWLHSLDPSSSLTNLSSLKQGIKMQQELVHTNADIYH